MDCYRQFRVNGHNLQYWILKHNGGEGVNSPFALLMKKIISHIIGMSLCALAILPPFNDKIPMFNIDGTVGSTWNLEIPIMVNSFLWTYLVIVIGLLCAKLWSCKISLIMKAMASYMYVACYFSVAPYISFNAMLFVVPSIYLFILIKNNVDPKIIIDWIVALFWFELLMCVMQYIGRDKLLNFDRPQKVFLGTVMQHMRSGSLIAIMAPFLLLRNKLFIIPLVIVAFIMSSSNLAISLAVGAFAYFILCDMSPKRKCLILGGVLGVAVIHSIHNQSSFITAFTIGRIPVWGRIIATGLGGVYHSTVLSFPDLLRGFLTSFKGHGLNIFPVLFPVLIEDANPFAQCHNDWMQIWWELGKIGLGLAVSYCIVLARNLYAKREILYIVGIVIISTNMCFAFPTYMLAQTPLMMLCFFALCEKAACKKEEQNA